MKRTSYIEWQVPRDVAIYIILSIAIAWIFELVPSGWLERLTAEVASYALRTMRFSSVCGLWADDPCLILIGGVRDVSVTIVQECIGIHAFAIFTGLVIPLIGGL